MKKYFAKRKFSLIILVFCFAMLVSLTSCISSQTVYTKSSLNTKIVSLLNTQKYNDDLYKQGIVYEELPDLNAENSYIISNRFKENIISNIKIGTSKKNLLSILGKPISDSDNIQMYAFDDIYVGFYGKDNVDLAIVRKVTIPNYNSDILGNIIDELNSGKSLKDVYNKHKDFFDYIDSRPFLRGDFAHSNAGIEIMQSSQSGETDIEVFINFKGNKNLVSKNKDIVISSVNNNNLTSDMQTKIAAYQNLEKQFTNDGILSPDKTKTLLNCFIDGSCHYVMVGQNDNSKADKVIDDIYSMNFKWIDNRFIVNLDVTFKIQIIDSDTKMVVAELDNNNIRGIKEVTKNQIVFLDDNNNPIYVDYKIENGIFKFE